MLSNLLLALLLLAALTTTIIGCIRAALGGPHDSQATERQVPTRLEVQGQEREAQEPRHIPHTRRRKEA